MPTTAKALTWEEFENLPADGMHREIVEGVVIVLPPPKSGHTLLAHRICQLLADGGEGVGRALIEAGYKLSEYPPTWVQPDVSFLSSKRFEETPPEEYFLGAPELAVEIVSPSESAADIDQKVALMLANGAGTVWVVYPHARCVMVHQADGTISQRAAGDVLTAPVLPALALPVNRIFEDYS